MPPHQQDAQQLLQALPSHEDNMILASSPTTANTRRVATRDALSVLRRAHTTGIPALNVEIPRSGPSKISHGTRTTSLTIIEPISFAPRPSARSSPLVSRAPSLKSSEQRPPTGSSSSSLPFPLSEHQQQQQQQQQQQRPRTGSSTSTAITFLTNDNNHKVDGLTLQSSLEAESGDSVDCHHNDGNADAVPASPIWTPAMADRLTFVQRMKWESQKRWSAGQEAWAKEEEHLLELRRARQKAVRKATADRARAEPTITAKHKKPFLGRSWPGRGRSHRKWEVDDGKTAGTGEVEISDDGDEMEEGRVAEFAAIPGGRIKGRMIQSSPPTRQTTGLKGLMRRMSGGKV